MPDAELVVTWDSAVELTLGRQAQNRKTDGLTHTATSHAQIHGFELSHPIYDLWKDRIGPVMQTQCYSISMAQGKSMISERSAGENPVLIA